MSLIRKDFDLDGTRLECWAFVTTDNTVFCKLKELSELLGYSDPKKAYKLIEDKWKITWSQLIEQEGIPSPCSNWQPNTIFVSEPGINYLIFRSKKPEAKRFRDHIIEVVLPTIRKTGAYISPDISVSQANSLVEELRGRLAERDRMLAEAQGELVQKNRMLKEALGMITEKVEMLVETERALTETRGLLTLTKSSLDEMNQTLANEKEQKRKLEIESNTFERNVRPKIAVIPDKDSVRHTLRIYKNGNTYRITRTQNRGVQKARNGIPKEFQLVYEVNTPNPLNVYNRVRELLPSGISYYTTIVSEENVVDLVKKCIEEEVNRPITHKRQ